MRLLATIFLFVLTINTVAQEYSRVRAINGVDAYILSEPVRDYKVVSGTGKGIQWGSFITGGLINESISTKLSKYVKSIVKQLKKDNITIDGVIYSDGKNVSAIQYLDEKTEENNKKAMVYKIYGMPFYVLSEPLKEYKLVKEVGGGIKWKSAFTGGLLNNSIEQDLERFAKKLRKSFRKGKIDAVIYRQGKKAEAIKFID